MGRFICLMALLSSIGNVCIAAAIDEMTLYNRSNCMGALSEFYGARYVFNSKLTGTGSISVAERGENGSIVVYNKNGQVAVGDVTGCRNQNRSLTASKKIAELLKSGNDFIDKSESLLKDRNVNVISSRPGTSEDAKARALSETADRRLMLAKLYEVCKAAGDPEIAAAIVDAQSVSFRKQTKDPGTVK